jgi:hypothetical protein
MTSITFDTLAQELQLETKADITDLKVGLSSLKADNVKIEGQINLIQWMLALVILVNVIPLLKSMFSA